MMRELLAVVVLSCLSVGSALRRVKLGASTSASEYRFLKRNHSSELPSVVAYPANLAVSQKLQGTKAVSVRWFGHAQVGVSLEPALGKNAGAWAFDALDQGLFARGPFRYGHPDDADARQQARFWHEFKEVATCQQMRQRGGRTKRVMSMHPLWEQGPWFPGDSLDESAQRVRADFPTQYPTELTQRWMASDDGFTLDANIFHRPECGGGVEFVNGAVALGGLIGWAVQTVSPVAFATKWHIGRARPEEVAYSIRSGELEADEEITALVNGLNFSDATGFTAYPGEGSPVHPAYPAMHSAASSMSAWADIVGNLTAQQRGEARLMDFSVAYYRTLAGVHYPSDNRAGLALGQYIVQKHLPGHLAKLYSCDKASAKAIKAYVEEKIQRLNLAHPLDWAVWKPEFFAFTEFDDLAADAQARLVEAVSH